MIQTFLTLLMLPLLRLFMRHGISPPQRILVIQVAKIGDFICTTPLLRELRSGLPQANITVLASSTTTPLLRANPRADAVMVADPSEWRGFTAKLRLAQQLRRGNFDTVLCCNGGATWPAVTLWAGIPQRIGILPNFGGRTQRLACRLLTIGIPHRGDRLIVETYFDMLRALGLSPGQPDKEVFAASGAGERVNALRSKGDEIIGIAVSAANKLKELGTDKLANMATSILRARPQASIILLGTASDAIRADAVLATLDDSLRSRVSNTCGLVALADLPALLAQLTAFVGVDSGLTYMADALKIPLVSVAGPCNMAETRPVNPHAIIIQRRLPCLPCAHIFRAPTTCHTGTLACIREITAAEVAAALNTALDNVQ